MVQLVKVCNFSKLMKPNAVNNTELIKLMSENNQSPKFRIKNRIRAKEKDWDDSRSESDSSDDEPL